jgi:hypothetical protein
MVDYSYLNASTGFLFAARQLCKFTVIKAIPKAIIADKAKIHQLSCVLYTKFRSQLFIVYQAIGDATTNAATTQIMNSPFKSINISEVVAPATLLIPISFVRRSIEKIVIPSIPNIEIMIASSANDKVIFRSLLSD